MTSERQIKRDGRQLRRAASDQARRLGHDLTKFRPYKSMDGKYTAFCHDCGYFAIVYDTPPALGDQISGRTLNEDCPGCPGKKREG